ncbi:(Fe-S)-binding protein [Sorangium cellulosum]|uniref:(Fe-S)-binding protein n=2 Tax=Sorangium cellulosum TaxID=56 RepID=A0A4P2PTV5_SORCE|nr:(Fe-S)-binding protein [Sorangium cellulosum]
MNPTWMLTLLVGLFAAFAWSANRRWQLLKVGRGENRLDRIGERLKGTWEYAFRQRKMKYYPLAGLAHKLIFLGFLVLLLRTLILWGRGFDPSFDLWILGHEPVRLPGLGAVPLGGIYEFLKDVMATLVVLGALVFIYYRAIRRERRMTLSVEGLIILGIILTMMVADMLYDGAALALHHEWSTMSCGPDDAKLCERIATVTAPFAGVPADPAALRWHLFPSPAGSLFGVLLAGVSPGALVVLAHVGFWTHVTLVLVFLNLLPHSKHFHIITAIPNVFARNIDPRGRLPLVAPSAEAIGEMVMKAAEEPDKAEPVGIARIEDVTWKAILDFYTCTECGRCSDNCPAHKTGKILSPKQLTLDLRDHLYGREGEFLNRPGGPRGVADGGQAQANGHDGDPGQGAAAQDGSGHAEASAENPAPAAEAAYKPVDLVPNVIHPDVLWACTTCRACEEQCPVMISYVDKIVSMRRNLVLVKGEFPAELGNPFQAMEVNGNPWNLARIDRGNWAEGLGVPTMAENPQAPVLYWVGCAASYDDRAKKIARSTARLLKAAGVDFAILGQEETCTGDPARRAGNEYLFAMLAEQNAATLNGYKEQGGIRKIVTTCPHCFNTLANEYPDFGAKFEVVHHTDFLLGLVAEKKLVPRERVEGKVVFHDSCYLGRYNDVYEQPRDILKRIPGVELVEAEGWNRQKGLCCGAGGAQMWMEEQNKDRVNVKRTLQLLQTEAKTIATACPFCQTMITDGLKDQSKEESIRQLDVVELLEESCGLDRPAAGRTAASPEAARTAAAASESGASADAS